MKLTFVFIVNCLTINYLFAQHFSGRLTYHYISHDSTVRTEEYRRLGLDVNPANTMTRTVWVKKDSMRHVTANDCGRLNWVDYQFGKEHYTNMSNTKDFHKTYERMILPKLPKTVITTILLETKKERLSIMGYECKEYHYQFLNSNSSKIRIAKVWIPIKLMYKKQHKYKNYFEFYFFPEGLVFRREDYTNGVLEKSYELTNIAFYDVPKDQFDECEEVVKKMIKFN
jgi:hypothetical protein